MPKSKKPRCPFCDCLKYMTFTNLGWHCSRCNTNLGWGLELELKGGNE